MSAEGFFGPGEQSLVDMIQMWGLNKTSGILTISGGKESGEVHFADGKAVWAKAGPYLSDEEAIYHILALQEGKFRFVNTSNIKGNGSWNTSFQEIIMEGMRRLDHLNDERRDLEGKFGFIPHIIKDLPADKLSEAEKVFWGLIDNRRNLEKIFNNCGLGVHKSLEVFKHFISEKIIALRKVRVLVVDDQAMWRKVISNMLLKEDCFEIVGTAEDGIDALKKLSELKPDVMTLDLEMPRLGGIKTLYWMLSGGYDIILKAHFGIEIEDTYRCPVVVISAVATKMAPETLDALMGGASGYITKPSQVVSESLEEQQKRIAKTVRMASQVDLMKSRRIKAKEVETKDEIEREEAKKMVCVGTSTVGGLTSLMQMVPSLSDDIDASIFVVIDDLNSIEHARSFAEFLDSNSNLKVLTADKNTILKKRTVYICPGSHRVIFGVTKTGKTAFKIVEEGGGTDASVKPSRPVDDMLMSAIKCQGFDKRVGVVLAGDGTDGKVGFLEMVKFGETVFAQDSYSSLNPVKPENIASTGVARIIPLGDMAKNIIDEVGKVTN